MPSRGSGLGVTFLTSSSTPLTVVEPAHKCHAKSGVGFGRDFLDLELDTIDGGGAGLEELLGRLFLCEGDKAEIFSFILSFVKWLLHLGNGSKLFKVTLDFII